MIFFAQFFFLTFAIIAFVFIIHIVHPCSGLVREIIMLGEIGG